MEEIRDVRECLLRVETRGRLCRGRREVHIDLIQHVDHLLRVSLHCRQAVAQHLQKRLALGVVGVQRRQRIDSGQRLLVHIIETCVSACTYRLPASRRG